ncbi:type II secretion system F family protein [Rhodopirellula europaea]|uniref:General secretion pathway protein F n=1 Tax=Rhodopirellula europaea SH398 TaxID=1263868 RepID=M5SBL0_9BACT|nr:type II secretion system F family protein [Rhodopirellula europaea]EMI25072.1 general secretion pathway protein F [Rhodopirellula europaea SH398]
MSFPASTTNATSSGGVMGFLRKLNSIEVGGPKRGVPKGCESTRIPPVPLAQLMRLLLMLLQNGLTLPKALGSLAMDNSNRKYSSVLMRMRSTIMAGGSISDAMARYPRTFHKMQVQQVRLGERSGSLEMALLRVCEQVERKVALRKRIFKKISYPVLISVAGLGLMIFMCVVVVPEFETVYTASGVDLPPVTQFVTGLSRFMLTKGLLAFPLGFVAIVLWICGRRNPRIAAKMDAVFLRIPVVGPWLRDAAVLQFIEATSAMVQCGYKPIEAIEVASTCVKNRCVRSAIEDINHGVRRGEKLSVELGRYERFFPPTLCQLIGVGEQSGEFARSLSGTCDHLRERLESRIEASVGMLEPILTISLAIMIGGMVLSIYTPMFHMFEVLE